MVKKLISLIIVGIAVLFPAQSMGQFRYGAMIGGDISNLSFKQDLFTVDKNVGYSAGVVTELMFPGIGFGVDFGLFYEQRGATLDLGSRLLWSSQGYGKERLYLHYAVIPFHLRFKYTRLNGFEDILAPFLYVGPSVGLLVGHNKIDCFSYPFGELGIDFGIGAEIKRNWQVSANYTMGVTYALKDKVLSDFSARNSSWNVRVAYFF
ncbi:MAG: PorT family protein [Firmicutes bacterium]|nr:PorT family protein [Bacillota bacterium]MCM1402084.1 PorT family protein [Bacteroides sp.]MCM1477990.1 PorT family protein [Bacteroides sp.]